MDTNADSLAVLSNAGPFNSAVTAPGVGEIKSGAGDV